MLGYLKSDRKAKIKYCPVGILFSIRFLSIPTGRYFIFVFLLDFEVYQQGGILFLFFY
jgi:hypothetical protein